VAPEVIADAVAELGDRTGAGAYGVAVGPFDEGVQLRMELSAAAAAAKAAASKRVVVGRGARKLASGERGKLRVKLTRRGRTARNRRGTLRVRVVLTVTSTKTQARTTTRRRVTLKSA
jgi:hypothetical protein